jgi:hypothetical protein
MANAPGPLTYVGPKPQQPNDLLNKIQATQILGSAPVNRTGVSSQIHTQATTVYASKSYIDQQDATYALASYAVTQDNLNIADASVGTAQGVASLDASGKIPLDEMPALGAGLLLGPFGPTTSVTRRQAGQSPLDFCDFNIGIQHIPFQPLVYASVVATPAVGGRTVIEARISNGPAAYAAQTLVARGQGPTNYPSARPIPLIPVPTGPGKTPGTFPATMNIFISLYVYDLYQSSTVETTAVASASVYLLRTGES